MSSKRGYLCRAEIALAEPPASRKMFTSRDEDAECELDARHSEEGRAASAAEGSCLLGPLSTASSCFRPTNRTNG